MSRWVELGLYWRAKALKSDRKARGYWLSAGGHWWAYLAAGLLAGCAGSPPAEPEPRIVRVEVPVLVPCRTAETPVPAWASDGLKASDTLEVKVRALLAERRQRIGYERALVAANDACR